MSAQPPLPGASPPRACTLPARCPGCAGPNGCRLETGEAYKGPCWCEDVTLPDHALRRLRDDLSEPRCLCRGCLVQLAAHPEASWPELGAHRAGSRPSGMTTREETEAAAAGELPFDADWALSRAFLLARGFCCQNGCRNCPYGFDDGSRPRPWRVKTLNR